MQEQIQQAIESAERIVVLQADNPDADSLGSALALEHILGDMGKDVALYCGVTIPDYLHYIPGWDRVIDSMPSQFDLSIIVDASTYTLFEKLDMSGQFGWVKSKPCVVLDHHATVEKPLDFTQTQLIDVDVASTGEIIYRLASAATWSVSKDAAEAVMASILGDTQGLTNDLTKSTTYRIMADLTELGANRPMLEEARREYGKMAEKIYRYKGDLIAKTQFAADGQLGYVVIPQGEINEFSPLYNPAPLIQFDMLQVRGVCISIVFKTYDDGRITAALRSNNGYPMCGKLAEYMGGGGHANAAGFKITDGRDFESVKSACFEKATELLNETMEQPDETV